MYQNFLKRVLFGFLMVGFLGVFYSAYLLTHQVEITKNNQLAFLIGGPEKILNFDEAIKFSDCQARGPLPDPDCTPGAIFSEATKEKICFSGYSKTVRNVSQKLKKEIFKMYGIEYPVPFGSYEIDHLVPLALGGSNETANLWPKSAEPFPGFYEKNLAGDYLHEEVCDGKIALTVAQEQIAKNWFLIYNNLSDSKISELKSKYKNWADRKQ